MLGLLISIVVLNIRPFEPVVLTGEELIEFESQSVDELFCAVFKDGVWEVVPFQLDEQDVDGSYFFPDDGLFDLNDEFVLDPQDGGSMALISNFGDFPGIEGSPRAQIKLTDPLNGEFVYFYIFQSATPPTASLIERIHYDSIQDEVMCDQYILGFDDVHRRWDSFQMWEGSQWSSDLLDREKMRISGTIFLPYTIDDTNFEFTGLSMVTGPLRVIRQVRGTITVFTITVDSTIEKHYYNGLVTSPDGTISIDPALGINSVRISVDWSPNSVGISYSNMYVQDIAIDGQPDSIGPISFTQADLSALWSEFSRDNWSMVQIGSLAGIANTNQLYYYDDFAGGTGDGTSDTGDGMSYGDTGILFEDMNEGDHRVSSKLILDSTGTHTGLTAKDQFLAPILVEHISQDESTGLGELYDLWRQENPENLTVIITVLQMVDAL